MPFIFAKYDKNIILFILFKWIMWLLSTRTPWTVLRIFLQLMEYTNWFQFRLLYIGGKYSQNFKVLSLKILVHEEEENSSEINHFPNSRF